MKRKKTLGWMIVSLGIVAGIGWFGAHRNRILLPPNGFKITSVAIWEATSRHLPMPTPLPKTYFWASQEDLLHLERHTDGSTEIVRDRLTPAHTLQRDKTASVQLPARSSLLMPTPDGSGLLYQTQNAQHIHDPDIHWLAGGGKDDRILPALWMRNMVWMPDGKRWIVSRTDGDFLNSLDGAPFRKLDTSSLRAWYPYVLGVNTQGHAISTLGNESYEGPELGSHNTVRNYPTVLLLEFDPAAPAQNSREWKVAVPPYSIRGNLLLSPQADRILWIVEKQAPPLARFLDRLQLGSHRPPQGDQAVYVSRLDGSEMRELCSVPVKEQKWGRTLVRWRPLADFRWLPDGKRISFVYKDDLYMAPVD